MRKPINYTQDEKHVIRYDGTAAAVTNPETNEVISLIRRPTASEESEMLRSIDPDLF